VQAAGRTPISFKLSCNLFGIISPVYNIDTLLLLLLLLLLFTVAVAAVAVNHPRNWNSVVVGRNLEAERHWKENMFGKVRIMFR
jgi:hypothetical protein